MDFLLRVINKIINWNYKSRLTSSYYFLFILIALNSFSKSQVLSEQNYRIGKIVIQRNEVFDERDTTSSSWFTKTINWIHLLTRENTIRSRLLFKEGDVFRQDIIDETERKLRGLGILGEIEIKCDTVADNYIDIGVKTNDKWTLGINGSFKQDGGITNYGINLKENNFLGNAQSISFNLNYSSERINPYGIDVIFREPHFFNNWWNLILQYKKNEYLDIRTFLLERPYYSDSSFWSMGIYFDLGRSKMRLFNNGIVSSQYDITQENQSIWYSFRPYIFNKASIGFAYVRTRTDTDTKYLQPYDNQDLFNISFDLMNRKYFTTKFIENFGRIEDIPTGYRYHMILGKNLNFNNFFRHEYYFQISWLHALHSSFDWYISYDIDASGYLYDGKFIDILLNCSLLQHLKLSSRNLIILRGIALLGYNWSPNNQFILGSPSGLRGYPAYAFNGNRKLLFNIEHRFFSDFEFLIFRFGTVLFFDSGMVWNESDILKRQKFHSSVGFGFRIENIKQSGSGILRIDFAFNLDQNKFAQVIFSSDHLFRAFQNIQYETPLRRP